MPKIKDLIGQKFGRLTPYENTHKIANDRTFLWLCRCDCGNIVLASTQSLTSGHKKSCGCLRRKDIKGQRFGNLIAMEFIPKLDSPNGRASWLCKCDCGKEVVVEGGNLRENRITHCGCQIYYSIGEKNIKEILNDNEILFKKEVTFDNLINPNTNKKLRFDFAILNKNNKIIRLIEFDGEQHKSNVKGIWNSGETLEERKYRDELKNQWAKDNNIPLVRIPYWERDSITLEKILGDKYLVT